MWLCATGSFRHQSVASSCAYLVGAVPSLERGQTAISRPREPLIGAAAGCGRVERVCGLQAARKPRATIMTHVERNVRILAALRCCGGELAENRPNWRVGGLARRVGRSDSAEFCTTHTSHIELTACKRWLRLAAVEKNCSLYTQRNYCPVFRVYWKPPADLLQKPPAECGRMSEIENSQSADREHEVSAWVSRGRGTSRAGALGAPVARESGAGTWSRLTRVAGGCKLTCTHARQ